ncbi:MAG: HAD family hydrolase [Coprococcus sp.]
MQPQLLFFDIDGTLLSDYTHEIPDSAILAIRQAQANGHLAFINTGRTIRTIPDAIKALPFDGFLCGCGTRIICHGRTLMSHSFSMERGIELIDLIESLDIETFLEGSEDVYCKRGLYRQNILNQIKFSFRELGLGLTSFIDEKNFIFDKFIIISDDQNRTDQFIQTVHQDIEAIDRGNGMYECIPRGFSKASGMYLLSDHLNISMDNTWAFGDSSNDLTMLKAAAHGIAMGEHSSALDPYAEIIADTVENNGIAKALKKAGLI